MISETEFILGILFISSSLVLVKGLVQGKYIERSGYFFSAFALSVTFFRLLVPDNFLDFEALVYVVFLSFFMLGFSIVVFFLNRGNGDES